MPAEEAPAEEAMGEGCPPVTMADARGVPAGAFPEQYDLAEFESAAGCELSFSENPNIAELNKRIGGNPDPLPPVEERLPAEPLVVVPYDAIGVYGGTLDGLSNATESGTSDLLSVRHVNFARYSDDLQTIVPNVAKGWEWNDDFTELTIFLREGHKWSDGEPFTAADVEFWYNDIILNPEVFPETPSLWLIAGEPMEVTAVDDTTVSFKLPVPAPGLLTNFAISYAQPFQPKHFLQPIMENEGIEAFNNYYGNSDWKDVPSPLIDGSDDRVMPTLESYILVEETTEGRKLVANPFFHMVDTQGNQLPYINEINEQYIPDDEVRNLKITNGEVDYKSQAVFIDNFPLYKENEEGGGYGVELAPGLGQTVFYAFNVNHKDPALAEIFGDLRFRQAMSVALNRDEMNEIVYLGQGKPMQATPADPNTVSFVTEEHLNSFIEYDPDQANALLDEMGLVDTDGDGFRERPDGESLVVLLEFSNQGAPVQLHQLTESYWEDVGIQVELKEVTSDEYREEANNNNLDLTTWKNDNTSGVTISQNPMMLVPPFGNFFNPGGGFEWAKWKASDGAEGIEPPDDIKRLYELADQFVQVPLGSPESDAIGKEIVDIHVKNLWKIGVVGDLLAPVVHKNTLGNFRPFTAKAYDYYWAYPYRPVQWYLEE
ncbi:MAG TPA: ABC transporter substrate-binding protein [Anaerolineae bacterium]|nr:ABC transporter substrate-binding protein [Anaerolineae bacterium]HIP70060.1 ABC transporter substrate-binding protein [Anaerolineae bacterium]